MIAAGAAQDAATASLDDLLAAGDPMFASWPRPSAGMPVTVHDVTGAAAYWLVPLEARDRVIGAARVDARGRVMTIGVTCRTPQRIVDCPRVVTGLTAEEAAARACSEAALEAGETPSPPRFVHDGPPGREAWLVETSRGGRPYRWIMVTPGGCAARAAGTRVGSDPDRE